MAASRPVTIAIDAMGGDHAPKEVIKGALLAAANTDARMCLVGDQPLLERILRKLHGLDKVDIIHAPDRISMDEAPAAAIRKKRGASIVVAAELVRDGKAQAVISAGSTGASMAVAALVLGRSPGIDRPAIATVFPTAAGQCVILDVGANVDSTVENLIQFAVMGTIYCREVMGVASPRVGLLSIGEESCKGNELVRAANKQLRTVPDVNFVGNIEGRPLFAGAADVVVCDGFVGNVALKVAEGVVELMSGIVKQRLLRHPWYGLMLLGMSPRLRKIAKEFDAAELGGAPLLGVNGVCIVSHGNSKARAIECAIAEAVRAHQNDVLGKIQSALSFPPSVQAAV